ncbi:MAG TPA: hypothetical protein VKQ36_11120 [Ktedonobacterales bacterium]|nr:hypothetical protein [Ktedonobacterales bacterium]
MSFQLPSLPDALFGLYLTIGLVELVYGCFNLLRRAYITQRLLDKQRKALRKDRFLASGQPDDETLGRIIQHQRRTDGVGGICNGLGAIIGCACAWLFHTRIASYFPSDTMSLDVIVTVGLAVAGLILGLLLGSALNGFIWRKPANQSLPPSLTRMSLYRPLWIIVLGCVTLGTTALAIGLTASGAVPNPGSFSQQQMLWLATLFPLLMGLFVLGPELLLWLSLHYPPWPVELEPALALRLVASKYQAFPHSIGAYFLTCSAEGYLLMGMVETTIASFPLFCGLGALASAWYFAAFILMFQKSRRDKSLRAALEAALAPAAGGFGQGV